MDKKKVIPSLPNVGSTCYINSVLQCLNVNEKFVSSLLDNNNYTANVKKTFLTTIKERYPEITENEMKDKKNAHMKESLAISTCKLLESMKNATRKNDTISHQDLKNYATTLFKKNNNFVPGMQNDSGEFLVCLLDALHEETKGESGARLKIIDPYQIEHIAKMDEINKKIEDATNEGEKKKANDEMVALEKFDPTLHRLIISLRFHIDYMKKYCSSVWKLYSGYQTTDLLCKSCGTNDYSFTYYNTLDLPIPKKDNITLEDCFDQYFSTENVDRKCNKCNELRLHEKKDRLWMTPKTLIVRLKRFSNDGKKISSNITYPLKNLNMKKYYHPDTDFNTCYELYGIIMHIGPSSGGHYNCMVKSGDDWYFCDDTTIMEINYSQIQSNVLQSNNAYVLFYRKL